MKNVNRKKKNTNDSVERKRWLSVVGFLCSVTLLSVAIFLSINQEENERLAMLNESITSNAIVSASSELSKSVNEVKSSTNTYEPNPIILNEVTNNVANNSKVENEIIETAVASETDANNQASETVENQVEATKAESTQFIKPVEGEVYKEYSMDSLVYSDTLQEWVTHRGIDIKADMETEVKAVAGGTVKAIKSDPRYGLSVTIEHKDGFTSTYTCLVEASQVHEGDTVEQGQAIGKVGNSGVFEVTDGAHLHFEMQKDGAYINPEMYIK